MRYVKYEKVDGVYITICPHYKARTGITSHGVKIGSGHCRFYCKYYIHRDVFNKVVCCKANGAKIVEGDFL